MKNIIITIGDEILIGQTVNTNAAFIGENLTKLGATILNVICIGDIEEEILEALKYSSEKADYIHITGGLGPTHDDITRKCILNYFNTDLVYDAQVMNNIHRIFEKRKIKMAEINKDQAMVPRRAVVLNNELGTAPGFKLMKNNKIYYFTPGVPFEMKSIYQNHILPDIQQIIKQKNSYYIQRNILTTGIPEASLFELFGDVEKLIEDCKLAFLPSPHGVKLRLSLRGNNQKYVEDKFNSVFDKIVSIAKEYIFTTEDKTMEEIVAEKFIEKKLTLSTAESCTGGLIAHRLTNIPGSSAFFERGLVTYSNLSKMELLGVKKESLESFGAVSKEVAQEMAIGINNLSKTDFGLAITGIMGPGGGTEVKPVGTVFIAVSNNNSCEVKKVFVGDNRTRNKERASQAAFNFLLQRVKLY